MRRLISCVRDSSISRPSRLALMTGILLIVAAGCSALWVEGARAGGGATLAVSPALPVAAITVGNTTPTQTPTPCTPSTRVTEGDLNPGGIVTFGVGSGPGSVTVDHVSAGIGLQSLTVIGVPINATVNIPAFTPGTFNRVTVTFTATDPNQPVDFVLRAAGGAFQSAAPVAANIRVQCGITTCTPNPIVTNTADSGAGSLRQAIADACPNAIITFDTAGVFAAPQIITLTSGQLVVSKSLTIQGPGASQLSVSGNNTSRVFFIASGNTVTLDGLTISNGQVSGGFPTGYGGGIFNDQATLTVSRSTVSNNSASGFGGGIYNDSGTLTVSHSTVSNNTSSNEGGGGIANRITSVRAATLTVSNSTISGNSASGGGGGVFNEGFTSATATATISNSTISGNSAGGGGGIQSLAFSGGTTALNISNSTVSGNSASSNGGGISNLNSSATAASTIVSDNSALGSPDILNNGGSLSGSYNLVETTTGYSFSSGSNNITGVDPLLEKDEMGQPLLKDNGGPTKTIALLCGSPAIDKGISNSLPTDQRGTGFARTFDDPATPDATDIGAFERQQLCNTPPTITGATISRQQGAASSNSRIATVNDNEDDEDDLSHSQRRLVGDRERRDRLDTRR